MRYEPANARFFAQEICSSSLTDSIRLLGCFNNELQLLDFGTHSKEKDNISTSDYASIFNCSLNSNLPPKEMNKLESVCLLMRLLHDMALDVSSDKSPAQLYVKTVMSPLGGQPSVRIDRQKQRPPPLQLCTSASADIPIIIHSSVLITMFQLVPSISDDNLKSYLLEVLRCLLKSERNQQVVFLSFLYNLFLTFLFAR